MKKLRINKNRYGWSVELAQNLFLDLDVNNWWFLPNLEFDRRPGNYDTLIFRFSFLCVSLTFYRWGY